MTDYYTLGKVTMDAVKQQGRNEETFGKLARARIEKAAQDAGFDMTVSVEANRLVLRATDFSQLVAVGVELNGGFIVELSDPEIGHQIALEFGIGEGDAASGHAIRLIGIADYQTLHRLLERVAAMCRVVQGAGLKDFEEKTHPLPSATDAIRLAVQRVGQNVFRLSLLEYWGGRCAVSGLDVPELLRASHIKPWADCASDAERLDVFNGLLLAPHLDALFDGGWVTFLNSGQIRISDKLGPASRAQLGITGTEVIRGLSERHKSYLAWHREHCLRQ